jgi:deoxyribonuclease V
MPGFQYPDLLSLPSKFHNQGIPDKPGADSHTFLVYDSWEMADLHPWDLAPDEAVRVQKELRDRLVLKWDRRPVTLVGGVDVSIQTETARAAIVVIRYPDLSPLEGVTADAPLVFPYIPGLLAFREGPAVLAAWEKLQNMPDLVMFDGQGIAHPRGMGIASLMGLWLERPTIGVAKSRLFGRHAEVGPNPGDRVDLLDRSGNIIGMVLRTRERTNPLYISPGHMIDVKHATEFVLACSAGYRLPEPTRWAHKVAGGSELPGLEGEQPRLF